MELNFVQLKCVMPPEDKMGMMIQMQMDFTIPYRDEGYEEIQFEEMLDRKVRIAEVKYRLSNQKDWQYGHVEDNAALVRIKNVQAKEDVLCSIQTTYYTHPRLAERIRKQEVVFHEFFCLDYGEELGELEWHRFTVADRHQGVAVLQVIDPSGLSAFFDLGKHLRSKEYVFLIDEQYNLIHGLEKKVEESAVQFSYILSKSMVIEKALDQVLRAIVDERISIEMLKDEMSLQVLIDIGLMVEGAPYGDELMEVGINELGVMEETLAIKERNIHLVLQYLKNIGVQ